jgi:DNA-binding NtrC family response regulator
MTDAPCRALVLEDDRAIGSLLQRILTREGFAVQLVDTALAAIQLLEADRFHLVLLDLMVPDYRTDVIDFIKTHHLELLKAIVVVSADAGAIAEAMRGEFPEPICKFIAKPFDVGQLMSVIHSCKQLCGIGEHVHAPST